MQNVVLSAGCARVEITPDPAMRNWVTGEPYDGVIDSLFARSLALYDGANWFVIICWDLIDAREEAVVDVRKAVCEATGIPGERILVGASHTHSGPRSPYTISSMPQDQRENQRPVLEDAVFRAWALQIPNVCANLVKQAQAAAVPVTLSVGRANANEWLFNRRPVDVHGQVVTMFKPDDANCLPDGLRFSPFDPTLMVLSFCTAEGKTVATLFSVPCHSVSVYPHHQGISADWPGVACDVIVKNLGGEAFFLQGCAGEIVPTRRGLEARHEMAHFFAQRAMVASKQSLVLTPGLLTSVSQVVYLPLAQGKDGVRTRPVEVQVLVCDSFALVTLPGEPLNGLARAIQARSPFPHTLIVGYANGRGVSYVGLPGEWALGGYESRTGRGADEAGLFLIETAVRLLHELKG